MSSVLLRRLALAAQAFAVLMVLGVAAAVLSPAERTDAPTVAAAPVAAAADPSTTVPSTTTTPPLEAEVLSAERSVDAATTTTAAPTTTTTVAAEPTITEVAIRTAVEYGSGATPAGDVDLRLDLYAPMTDAGEVLIEGQPAAIVIHGGGFTQGSRTEEGLPQLAEALARHGVVTVSIDHRLVGDDPLIATPGLFSFATDPIHDRWLAPASAVAAAVEDTIVAADWLLDQGVDADRLFVGGSSAGAITALYLAHANDEFGFDRPAIAGVIDLWGGYTLSPDAASVLDAGEAPVWVVHGTEDPIVSHDYSVDLVAAAEAVGVRVVLNSLDGAGHAFPAIDLFADRAAAGGVLIDDLLAFIDEPAGS